MNRINIFFERINKRPLAFLFLIVFINALLKFFQISDASIWLDEAHTATQSLKSISEIISDSSKDQNPPLYFIIMHLWTSIFGISEFGIRSFSTLLSLMTVIILFFFARRYFNIKIAFIACLLFTFSEQQIYFSVEARTYALVGFLTVASFSLFYKLINLSSLKTAIFLGIINSLLIYSHFISCFIVGVQGLFALILLFRDGRKIFGLEMISIAATCLLTIPWFSNIVINAPKAGVYWLAKPGFYNLKGLFISFSNGKLMTVVVMILLCLTFLFAIKRYLQKKQLDNKHYQLILLLLWFLFPVLADYLISIITPIFLNKYLLYASIGLYLLVGFCITELPISNSIKVIIAVFSLMLFIANTKIEVKKTEDWRGTTTYVKSIMQPDDIAILSAACVSMPFSYYFDKDIFTDYRTTNQQLNNLKIFPTDEVTDEEMKIMNPKQRIILVQSHAVNLQSEKSPLKMMEKNFEQKEKRHFGDIEVFTFQKPSMRN